MGENNITIKNNRLRIFNDKNCAIKNWDWILFIAISVFCFLSFEQGDIYNTGNRGWMFYHSNVFNYYDVLHQWTNDYGASYLPSTFIMYAIWVLPLKLLGFQQPESVATSKIFYNMWYKLLPVLFFVASAYLIYKVAMQIGMGAKKSKICMFAFLTMPLAFYSQFMFSQYDVFTVFFVLCGMYFYFRNGPKDRLRFCIFFGIAITFKYFALLIFFVLLLLDEKNVIKVIKYTFIAAIPGIIEIAINAGSKAFWKSVFGFNAISYVSQSDFSTILGSVSFFKIICCFMVIWPFFVYPKDKNDRVKWALYFCCGVCFGIFDFATWHPQWFMFVAPFWVLGAFISMHLEKFLWIDTVFIAVFYMFVNKWWLGGVDDSIMNNGIWRHFLNGRPVVRHIADYISFFGMNTLYSIIFVLILVMFVFKHPKYCLSDFTQEDGSNHIWLMRLRFFAATMLFIIPAFLSFYDTMSNNYVALSNSAVTSWEGITSGNTYEQHFSGIKGELSQIDVQLAAYGRKNTSNLTLELKDEDSGEVLANKDLTGDKINDLSFLKVGVGKITLDANKKYVIILSSTDAVPDNCYGYGATKDNDTTDSTYATVNGDIKDINMNIDLNIAK